VGRAGDSVGAVDFGFVSDFLIRISDFVKAVLEIADRYPYRGLKCESFLRAANLRQFGATTRGFNDERLQASTARGR
jgi:hypothetical protein